MKTSLNRAEVVSALSKFFAVDDADRCMRAASFGVDKVPSAEIISRELGEGNRIAADLIGTGNVTEVDFTPKGATVRTLDGETIFIPFDE